MAKRFTALSVAQCFVTEICRLHGVPRSILSDRDPIFQSTFWQEIFRLSGTTIKQSSAYHPETDGQTEITNKGLEQYLRCFCMENPSTWMKYLPWAEFSYNSATHTATRMPPFLAVYGRLPPPLLDYGDETTTNAAAHDFLTHRTKILQELRANLAEAQNSMKLWADKKRRDVEFQIGDRVLVRLQPYRQLSLAEHTFSKLQRRFYGPFTVVKRIGSVAYKVDLPATSKIYPVFHSSKLKLFREDSTLHPHELPPTTLEGKLVVQPLQILRHRWVIGRARDQLQLLVQWEGLPLEESSWLEIQEFREAYPNFDLEGKVVVDRGSDVMNTGGVFRRRKAWIREAAEMGSSRTAREDSGLNMHSKTDKLGSGQATMRRNAIGEAAAS